MALTVPFLFSNGRCCTEQRGLTVPCNYQQKWSEPKLKPFRPLAPGNGSASVLATGLYN